LLIWIIAEGQFHKMISESFRLPSLDLKLANDEIHIWCTSLDQPTSLLERLVCTLSIDERARAGRFYFEEDRKRFIIRHGILRMILGYYLGVKAGELQFSHGRNGKPRLADTFRNRTIPFSMSSSEGLALYGFTRNREIGIDVECVRDIPEMDQIAELIFSAAEALAYHALPEHLKREVFFASWTRKEAFLKATGDGLSRPLDKIELTVDAAKPARLLEMNGASRTACRWSIHDLKPTSGFAAAIVAEGQGFGLRCWQWTGCNPLQVSA
jgi:4'-phosphopantetheinyl transferase